MKMYFHEFNRKRDPFAKFKQAWDAKAKGNELQNLPDKRKQSSLALNKAQMYNVMYYV